MPDQVPPRIIDERRERIRSLERELAQDYYQSLVGTELSVMVEGEVRPGVAQGTSCRFAPVAFRGHAPALVGTLVPIHVDDVNDDGLLGRPALPSKRLLLPLI